VNVSLVDIPTLGSTKSGPLTPWIVGTVKTAAAEIPVIRTRLDWSDRRGSWKARWSIGRMRYRVEPGLYAAGKPGDQSPVFVSANYKMSFDLLRAQLSGIDSWIMVLDTKGVNVWCAAGKGTFGTDEIVARMDAVRLGDVVSHRKLILPQLGAPGVSAHEVKRRTGFRVVYGPVRAEDIPRFMSDGLKATPEMRQVRFGFRDRIILVPQDIVGGAKYIVGALAVLLLASGFGEGGYSAQRIATSGVSDAALLFCIYLAAAILPPALLPWLPGRAFSAKGAWLGVVLDAALLALFIAYPGTFRNWFAMEYTSLSGVKKEMRVAVPLQAASAVLGIGLWITGLVV